MRVEVPATIHSKHEDKERKTQTGHTQEREKKSRRRREVTVIDFKIFGTKYRFLLNISEK